VRRALHVPVKLLTEAQKYPGLAKTLAPWASGIGSEHFYPRIPLPSSEEFCFALPRFPAGGAQGPCPVVVAIFDRFNQIENAFVFVEPAAIPHDKSPAIGARVLIRSPGKRGLCQPRDDNTLVFFSLGTETTAHRYIRATFSLLAKNKSTLRFLGGAIANFNLPNKPG